MVDVSKGFEEIVKHEGGKVCVQMSYEDDCEPPELYPLDDDNAALQLFNILGQMDQAMGLKLVSLTKEEWEEAEHRGRVENGEINEDGSAVEDEDAEEEDHELTPPSEMPMKQYLKEAARTEPDYTPTFKRIDESSVIMDLSSAMADSVSVGEFEDRFKKLIFYGRNMKSHAKVAPARFAYNRTSHLEVVDRLSQLQTMRVLHGVMGVSTEAGELEESLYNHLFLGKPLDHVNLREEIGDVMWYLALLCNALDTSFEEIADGNIKKLRARFPDKFTDDLAINRDTNNERKVLEKSFSSEGGSANGS